MQKPTDKTGKILLQTEQEVFDKIVPQDHEYRRLERLFSFYELVRPLRKLYSNLGKTGIDVEYGFKSLLVQFWRDYSDREMEKALNENVAIRWFCGFGLTEKTPDFSYFSKLRRRVGPSRLARLFREINDQLDDQGLFGNTFTFVDATAIITKNALWDERDRAIAKGEEKLNNKNVMKYAADFEARWGAKGKNKIWFGYKNHTSVDMRHGLINMLCVTPANVLDFAAFKNICPNQGMVFCDKLYSCREVELVLKARGLFSGIIMKRNNQLKNRELDNWRSKIRMPFEGTFSKRRMRARFRGQAKVFFQCTFEAICHNLKKAITILPLQPAT